MACSAHKTVRRRSRYCGCHRQLLLHSKQENDTSAAAREMHHEKHAAQILSPANASFSCSASASRILIVAKRIGRRHGAEGNDRTAEIFCLVCVIRRDDGFHGVSYFRFANLFSLEEAFS